MDYVIDAPAKTNLWLHLRGRRADGYHEIHTRMIPLALRDTLHFSRMAGEGVEFTCDDAELPVDGTNLVLKAVASLRERGVVLPGLRIHLEKRVPSGAGLGGGSSDAASTLLGLNEWLGLGLDTGTLAECAASFGSDVPFFIYRTVCDCSGRGEIVTPVRDFPWVVPLLLVKLPFSVPTPWAYKTWAESRELEGVSHAPQVFEWGTMVNDLERPVFAKHLVLADMKQWLLARPEVAGALLSGSGATMLAVLREGANTEALIADVRAEYGECWVWTGKGGAI